MFRVYDTNALWRYDEIIRIRHLEAEIGEMQKEIDSRKQKAVAAVERLERTKKWLVIVEWALVYLPELTDSLKIKSKNTFVFLRLIDDSQALLLIEDRQDFLSILVLNITT